MMMRLPTIAELNSGSVAAVQVEYVDLPKLNPQQSKFVDEYMKCGNATAAAIRVGYSKANAHYLISQPNIEAHILWRQAQIKDAYDISKNSLLRELGKIVGTNLDDFLVDDGRGGKTWDFSMVQRDQMAAVSEYSTEPTRNGGVKVKVKLADKLAAIEKIAKLLGYNEPDRVQSVNLNATVTSDMTPQDAAEAYRRIREGG